MSAHIAIWGCLSKDACNVAIYSASDSTLGSGLNCIRLYSPRMVVYIYNFKNKTELNLTDKTPQITRCISNF